MNAEPIPESPYQGLEPFREADRAYFFGRVVDTERIGANLITSPLTIFYGASGVGKTSVLLAGVLPFVYKQPDVTAIVFRSWQSKEFEQQLKTELATAIAAKTEERFDASLPLDRCLDEAARLTGGTIAVVFDQFEEYMLYHTPQSAQGKSFDTAFARAVNRSQSEVNFLIGIREDALARLDRFRQYIPDLLSNRQQLVHLDERGAEEAIRKPLDHYNEVVRAQGQPDLAMEIEEKLVPELIGQVRIGGGVGFGGTGGIGAETVVRVETPFLQMVLQKLWDAERKAKSRLMHEKTLHDLGDAKKIVLDHVDGVMKGLSAAERAAGAKVFDRLVTPSRSKIAYALSDLIDFAGDHGKAVPSLVKRLSDPHVRILREVAAGEGQSVKYEIFHDVLSHAVLDWGARYKRAEEARRRVRRQVNFITTAAFLTGITIVLIYREHLLEDAVRVERERSAAESAKYQKQLAEILPDIVQLIGTNIDPDTPEHELTKSAKVLSRAEEIYTRINDTQNRVLALGTLGDVQAARGDYATAITTLERALKIAPAGLHGLLNVRRAAVLCQMGRFEEGQRVLRAVIDDKSTDAITIGDALAAAANCSASGGDLGGAAANFEAAAEKTEYLEPKARFLGQAAELRQEAGQLEPALALWQQTLELQKAIGDAQGAKDSYRNIVAIRSKLKKVPDFKPVVVPTDPTRCAIATLDGYWRQIGAAPPRGDSSTMSPMWRFTTSPLSGSTLLQVDRTDGYATGTLVRQKFEFVGSIRAGEKGEDTKIFFAMPVEGKCDELRTNIGPFVRTKSPAAAK